MHQGRKGIAGSFSFSAPKIISTGQGGAIITDDDELAYNVSRLKDFGRSGGGNDVHEMIGFNFKFTDIQAVIGIVQMGKLEWRMKRMKDIYSRYKKNLKNINEIYFFDQDLQKTTPWFIDLKVENRNELMAFLKLNKIGSRVMYPPINKQKAYNIKGEHRVSNIIGEKGLWLPSSSKLTNEQIDYVCDNIKNFYLNNIFMQYADIAIVILSCDKFKVTWKPCIDHFFNAWPDCPHPVFLLNNFISSEDERVKI